MIIPLPAALELYELKEGISSFVDAFLTGRYDDDDISLGSLRAWAKILEHKIKSIDLKYPTNDNGILKEQK